jgi:uncharacterized protein YecE (DUF72 family)
LAHYATIFDTVELNASFYRLPPPEQFARWAAQVPEGFLFRPEWPDVCTSPHQAEDLIPHDNARTLQSHIG